MPLTCGNVYFPWSRTPGSVAVRTSSHAGKPSESHAETSETPGVPWTTPDSKRPVREALTGLERAL